MASKNVSITDNHLKLNKTNLSKANGYTISYGKGDSEMVSNTINKPFFNAYINHF